MPLAAGTRLGSYDILSHIGSGGMGEVYRARDTKLAREVALKVLPEAFARDPERIARFRREAQLLASLNHPNIAAIYTFEESGGTHFLVMELVPGETLRERIKPGPLPMEEALHIGKQIAEALEAAHEKSIMHRDLKPANVKVTPEGQVKVLDFGLAKAFAGDRSDVDPHDLPTGSLAGTLQGTILGTPAYMSPEQARGKKVDKRTDIWAFGCVLYELLTGNQAFQGETITDIIAKVLQGEPDWSALPETTPPWVRSLLRRCLEKDLKRRFRDAADVAIQIEEALASAMRWPTPTATAAARTRWRLVIPATILALVALIAGLVLGSRWRSGPTGAQPITHSVIPLSEPIAPVPERPAVALSPDGTRLVYVAQHAGSTLLYLREMDRLEASPIPGTEGASGPFFSPDGQAVAFFVGSSMKKVSLLGGAPVTVGTVPPVTQGASWGPDGTIIFTASPNGGLSRVAAAGGSWTEFTQSDAKKGENSHRWPEILPGGQALLFTLDTGGSFDNASIAVLSFKTGEKRILVEGGSNARYAPTGHLVFARRGTLLAVPFDLKRLRVIGAPVPVLEGVMTDTTTGAAHFAFSSVGSLVYVAGGARRPNRQLVWVDRKGAARPLAAHRRDFFEPSLSPDGKRLAVAINEGSNSDIWVLDIQRGTLTRLTFDPGEDFAPVWTPDGKRIAHSSEKGIGHPLLFWTAADASGDSQQLKNKAESTLGPPYGQFPYSWSPDGRVLIFGQGRAPAGTEIWSLSLENERRSELLLQTAFDLGDCKLSPDGRWLAYHSNESGRYEVYIQPYPRLGTKWLISSEGGTWPVWARNGRELFYQNGNKMMAVTLQTEPNFTAGTPRLLFEGNYEQTWGYPNYDVAPDGQQFVMIQNEQEPAPSQLNVVLNWFEELKRRVPAK